MAHRIGSQLAAILLHAVVAAGEETSPTALAAGHKGVWLSTDKMFETMRAIDAGRAVAAEMQRARRRQSWPDTFVE
jgi:hypothetical protein